MWCETAKPDLAEAREFAEGIHEKFPGKLLAYNCSPSFNWKRKLDDGQIAKFQRELGAMGYRFQFITLAGFHALNYSMFELARGYKAQQMSAYVTLQQAEFAAEVHGYTATKHQREVGAGYFDAVAQTVAGGTSSITALPARCAEVRGGPEALQARRRARDLCASPCGCLVAVKTGGRDASHRDLADAVFQVLWRSRWASRSVCSGHILRSS